MKINVGGATFVDAAAAVLIAAAAFISFSGCCPSIVPDTSAQVTISRIDTVYLAADAAIPSTQTEWIPINVRALCDSLLKENAETYTETQKQTSNQRHLPRVTGIVISADKGGRGSFLMRADLSGYTITIDSLHREITRRDSVSFTHTYISNECQSKWHFFSSRFTIFTLVLALIFVIIKALKFL